MLQKTTWAPSNFKPPPQDREEKYYAAAGGDLRAAGDEVSKPPGINTSEGNWTQDVGPL